MSTPEYDESLYKLLCNVSEKVVFEAACLGNPRLKNLGPEAKSVVTTQFLKSKCAEAPTFDLLTNTVSCKGKRMKLKMPVWSKLAAPLKAKIMVYCLPEPKVMNRDAALGMYNEVYRPVDSRIITAVPRMNNTHSNLGCLPEFTLFDPEWSLRAYARAWNLESESRYIQIILGREWEKILSREARRMSETLHMGFSDTPVWSLEQVYQKTGIPKYVTLAPNVAESLRCNLSLSMFNYTCYGYGHPRLYYKYAWHPEYTYSIAIPTNSTFDNLFYKFGMTALVVSNPPQAYTTQIQNILAEDSYDWCIKPTAFDLGESKKTVRLPKYYPIVDAIVDIDYFNGRFHPRIWTGRIRFRRCWQYEWRQTKDGCTKMGYINASKIAACNCDMICALRLPAEGADELQQQNPDDWEDLSPFVLKPKKWIMFDHLLNQIFYKKHKGPYTRFKGPLTDLYSVRVAKFPEERDSYMVPTNMPLESLPNTPVSHSRPDHTTHPPVFF